ncbi:hypothetical protein CVN76_11140 [Bacillus sp. mrc49]|nr:hypothetical protein CVN76_11140 [Bacillus sp. mrc49]
MIGGSFVRPLDRASIGGETNHSALFGGWQRSIRKQPFLIIEAVIFKSPESVRKTSMILLTPACQMTKLKITKAQFTE